MQTVYEKAKEYVGVSEVVGSKHNPTIVAMFKASGHEWVKDDETPWCAAFVNAVLADCDLRGTGKLNARSFLEWGEPVDLANAEHGDVVVFWRGSPDGWQGHVGFFAGTAGQNVMVLGGNQSNKVNIAAYGKDRLLGVRRVRMPRSTQLQSSTQRAVITGQIGNAVSAWQVIPQLDGTAQIIAIAAFVAVGAALLWIARERNRKWKAGDR
jgi:uncharacterized protein (TIGR02594 family)